MRRRGQTLLAVLMVLSLAATLAMAAGVNGRDAVLAIRNRVAAQEAAAVARGCAAERMSALAERYDEAPETAWPSLGDGGLPAGPWRFACAARLVSANRRLDLALVDRATVVRAVAEVAAPTAAEHYTALILAAQARLGRSGTLEEHLQGLEPDEVARLSTVLSVGTGPVDLLHADERVLAALPGIGPSGARAIVERRAGGWVPQDLREVMVNAKEAGAYPALSRVAVLGPLAWELHVTARAGARQVAATEEWHLVRAAGTLAVAGRVVR